MYKTATIDTVVIIDKVYHEEITYNGGQFLTPQEYSITDAIDIFNKVQLSKL